MATTQPPPADSPGDAVPERDGWAISDLLSIDGDDWVALGRDLRRDLQHRHTMLMASGVAFRAFLALFSTVVVASSALVLAQPPDEIISQTRRLTLGLPASAREVLITQVETIVLTENTELRITFALSLVLAVWLAASTIQGVMDALTATNSGVEDRSWVRRRVVAVGLTVGALVFVATSLAVITGLPTVLGWFGIEQGVTTLTVVAELVGLGLMMFTGLLVMYHFGPAQPLPSWRWTWPGALVGTATWVIGTEAFAQFVERVGAYNVRFGTVAGVAVLLLWLLLTSWGVLLGAIVNARLARRRLGRVAPTGPIVSAAIEEAELARGFSPEPPPGSR